jgi:hypothetical protein
MIEMIFQPIDITNENGEKVFTFHAARHFGERDTWIQVDVLNLKTQEQIPASEIRISEFSGSVFPIAPTEWILKNCENLTLEERGVLENLGNAFEGDNSQGQRIGESIHTI